MTILLEQATPNIAATSIGRRPRLLLVAYTFPPVGGAGVQRPVKWVKNLHRFGWDVTVLTTENPSVPVRDESLLADIPENVLVVRARTWEPGYQAKQRLIDNSTTTSRGLFSRLKATAKNVVTRIVKTVLQPDPQILWVPNALRAGRRILCNTHHDLILVTAPAYSSFFIGTSLKRQFGLPLVLDFRDEWDMSGKYLENAQRDGFSRFIQERMQRSVLKQADGVVATTKASTENLAEKLAQLKKRATRTATVYNGFDSEDFQSVECLTRKTASAVEFRDRCTAIGGEVTASKADTFRLLYTGTLWNLTTIEPLVEAVERLHVTDPGLVSRLELVCVGRKTHEQKAILERLGGTACRLKMIDYCEHSEVLEWLKSTDAVCLLLSDVDGAERVVPAKLFEYLANRKDMLAIVPNGETADIVQRFFPAGRFEPKDIGGIAVWLKERLAGLVKAKMPFNQTADINEYSRTNQTARLVELLNELVPQRRAIK